MRAVKAAIAANSLICILKFAVAAAGGSATMFAEAIHSFADTANQALLMLGIRRSLIGPSRKFPFGRAQERFVWGLISACGVFFVGAGVTIYHGISALIEPQAPEFDVWTKVVIGIALVAEGSTLFLAWIDRKEGDTTNLAVILEDSAAVLGLLLAGLAVYLTDITGEYYWDAIGSIIVGLILAVMAMILVWQNLEYLIEKASPAELQEEVRKELSRFPLIEEIRDIRMIVLTPETHRVRAEVELNGYLLVKEMEDILKEEYEDIKDFSDFLQFCSYFANRVTRIVGKKIDEMEETLKARVPYLKNVDIKPS